jgi:hypothetical protein
MEDVGHLAQRDAAVRVSGEGQRLKRSTPPSLARRRELPRALLFMKGKRGMSICCYFLA